MVDQVWERVGKYQPYPVRTFAIKQVVSLPTKNALQRSCLTMFKKRLVLIGRQFTLA